MLCRLFWARKRGLAAPTAANRRRMQTRSTVSWVPARRARRPAPGVLAATAVATRSQPRPRGTTSPKTCEATTPALPSAAGMVAGTPGRASGISPSRRPLGRCRLAEAAGLLVEQRGERVAAGRGCRAGGCWLRCRRGGRRGRLARARRAGGRRWRSRGHGGRHEVRRDGIGGIELLAAAHQRRDDPDQAALAVEEPAARNALGDRRIGAKESAVRRHLLARDRTLAKSGLGRPRPVDGVDPLPERDVV